MGILYAYLHVYAFHRDMAWSDTECLAKDLIISNMKAAFTSGLGPILSIKLVKSCELR